MGQGAVARLLDVKDWARGKPTGISAAPIHDMPAPKLVDNLGIVLDAQTHPQIAAPFRVTDSTVRHWRKNMRVPLVYLAPILRIVSYEELAFGDVANGPHARRGWTRDPAQAARDPNEPGPINISLRSRFEDVLDRMRMMVGDEDSFHDVLDASQNQMTQWRKRAKIPDRTCLSFCDRHSLSLRWLLTGAVDDAKDD